MDSREVCRPSKEASRIEGWGEAIALVEKVEDGRGGGVGVEDEERSERE